MLAEWARATLNRIASGSSGGRSFRARSLLVSSRIVFSASDSPTRARSFLSSALARQTQEISSRTRATPQVSERVIGSSPRSGHGLHGHTTLYFTSRLLLRPNRPTPWVRFLAPTTPYTPRGQTDRRNLPPQDPPFRTHC